MRFVRKYVEAGNVWSFVFAPLEPVSWIAGQSLRLEVETFYGPEDHRMTIAAPPAGREIIITTRLSNSLYKLALDALQPGAEVHAHAIEGSFIWAETALPRVFIAAGVGVTPFYAMLAQRRHDGLPLDATLIYAAPDDPMPLANTFRAWQAAHPELRLHLLPAQRLSGQLLADLAPDLARGLVYLSGPSRMVDEIGPTLLRDFALPETQLLRDWFTGRLARDG